MSTFWQVAAKYPPVLCRLLARHKNGPPLRTGEIVEKSGWLSGFDARLTHYEVNAISYELSWTAVPFGKMHQFLVACGMDFCNATEMQRKRVYLRKQNKFQYLKDSPEWETVLRPLVMRFRELEHEISKTKTSVGCDTSRR